MLGVHCTQWRPAGSVAAKSGRLPANAAGVRVPTSGVGAATGGLDAHVVGVVPATLSPRGVRTGVFHHYSGLPR
jgi:hypothetical protein